MVRLRDLYIRKLQVTSREFNFLAHMLIHNFIGTFLGKKAFVSALITIKGQEVCFVWW